MEFGGSEPNEDPLTNLAPRTDPPPPGAIEKITPELILRLNNERPSNIAPDVKRLFGVALPYRIGPGDILNIVVWDHPNLAMSPAGSVTTDVSGSPVSNGYNVSPDGRIQFPYAGDVKVAGLTEYEVRNELVKRLSKYLNEPKVTVRIQSYRSGRVYIDGEVRQPGLQAVNDIPMTLPEALNRAGGLTADADRSAITISRNGSTTSVNLEQLAAQGVNPNHIVLSNGDLVHVMNRNDSKVYVMGEVTKPTAQPLRNGHLTLNEALGEAGGVNTTTGNPRQIYVVRADKNPKTPKIYHLDAKSPSSYALAEGFELKTRDVVYVDPAPVVQWSRVINMILPSAQVIYYGKDLSR